MRVSLNIHTTYTSSSCPVIELGKGQGFKLAVNFMFKHLVEFSVRHLRMAHKDLRIAAFDPNQVADQRCERLSSLLLAPLLGC